MVKSNKKKNSKIIKEKSNPELKESIKKNEKKEVISTIIAISIVLIIIIGTIYLISNASKPKVQKLDLYNGFEFFKDQNGFWNVELKTGYGDSLVPFYYHPSELEELEYDHKINLGLSFVQNNNGSVVIVFDKKFTNPNLSDTQSPLIAGVEIGKITSKVFGVPTTSAFNEDIPGVPGMRVFNCSMATQKIYVFEFKLAEPEEANRVYSEGLCAIIQVNRPEDTIMYADMIAFKLLGIMN